MPSDCISFRDTNYFSKLICDYLDEQPELQLLYNRFPKLEHFKAQIEEKNMSVRAESRTILVEALQQQYKGTETSEATRNNIEALNQPNTFTITTGHQLNLFTGPLYFLYKIISVINLTKELKQAYPDSNFVPVYWMATEDHDFDEINYFNFRGKKVQWSRETSGPVGRLSTEGLDVVFETLSSELGNSDNAKFLKSLFREAYVEHDNLASATRFLANTLFAEHGLVIVDGDDKGLKQLFTHYVKRELFEQLSFKKVTETNVRIHELKHKIQVNPREINLFYIKDNLRERIVFEDNQYQVLNTTIFWNEDEILKEVSDFPERFSPNALLRPLYQEVILPNLCYVGGGGELAYWFQLKSYFEAVDVTFPMLLLRNSALISTEKQSEKLEKLGLTITDLFLKQLDLEVQYTKKLSEIDLDFSTQKEHLQNQFKAFYELAKQTDKSFLGAVAAQEKKQLKGLDNLEKRLLKAQKRKLSNTLDRIAILQDELFPGQSLQERNTNFSEFYLEYGETLIPEIMKELQPLKGEFSIIEI